jgi:DNA-binding NtrC family response regulator
LRDLPRDIWQQVAEQGPRPPGAAAGRGGQEALPAALEPLWDLNGWNLARSLQYCERLLLEAALHKAHGNQSHTARLLGITPRSVYNKLHKYHLHR